jgi:hypothetical protein
MANLILIHGRGQAGLNSTELEDEWIAALKKGLAANNLTLPESTNIIFPYYGDHLQFLEKGWIDSITTLAERGAVSSDELKFFNELLTEIAAAKDITNDQIHAMYDQTLKERGALNWGWVQAIMRTINAIGRGDTFLELFTGDVFMYLTRPALSREIDKFVKGHFNNEPTVVVAHSLGTIIAYKVLGQVDCDVDTLITLGSPLGVKSIKSKLRKPFARPNCLKGDWFNSYDDRDYIALVPLTRKYFNVDPEINNRSDMKNETSNHHGITGYLNDAGVAKIIYDRLMALTVVPIPASVDGKSEE